MSEISVGAALGAGFGLIRRKPLAVLAWGLLPAALQLTALAVLAPVYVQMLPQLIATFQAAGSGAAPPTPPVMGPGYLALQGLAQLLNLGQLFVGAMVYCAVWRAVLHPDKGAFGYLRVGLTELLFAALIFAGSIALAVAMFIVMIPLMIILVLAAIAPGGGAAFFVVLPIIVIAVMLAALFLLVRFAFVGPMMVEDGKFHFADAWALTRRRFGKLFLIGLGLFGIALVAGIVIDGAVFGGGAAVLAALAGGFDKLPALFEQAPAQLLARLVPYLIGLAVLLIPLTGCMMAIMMAPWARAYQDVRPVDAAVHFA